MTPAIKVRDNLFLEGNKIISFETHVADIVGGTIVPLGRFSQTTTKQLNFLSSALRLPFGESKDLRVWFHKYYPGVKCAPDNLLSPKTSRRVLDFLKQGKTFLESICSIPESEIPGKDLPLVEKYLRQFNASEEILTLRAINSIM